MIKYLLLLFIATNANAQTLRVVTSDFPPFQISVGNAVSGLATEVVEAVIKNAGYSSNIKLYPWARAYKMALKGPPVLIYSIVRSTEREKLFKWIGPIAPYNVYFWKLKERTDININSFESAKRYLCGGVFDDIKASQLQKIGFTLGKNLDLVSDDSLNIRKLYAGRIDIMTYDESSFRYRVEKEGFDFSKIEKVIKFDFSQHELQLAASLDTSDKVVRKLRASLIAFKKTSKYQQIKKRAR